MKQEKTEINRDELKNIQDVVIDTTKPPQERLRSFIEQIGDPYCYRDGDVIVEVGYAKTDISLQDRLLAYASSINSTTGNLR